MDLFRSLFTSKSYFLWVGGIILGNFLSSLIEDFSFRGHLGQYNFL